MRLIFRYTSNIRVLIVNKSGDKPLLFVFILRHVANLLTSGSGSNSSSSSNQSPRMRRFEPRAWDGLTDRRIAAPLYASPYGQGYNTQVRVQLPTSAGNVSLLAFAAERRAAVRLVARRPAAAAVDRYRLPTGMLLQRSIDGSDERTDGQTDAVALHRPCRILCTKWCQ